ncbi:cystathionine beta-lyase [Pseudomonas putida]|uniref:cystathionine beta-lyase n=1 Tax=Pseudomonas putida TaxID=303 RepID=UPI0021F8BED6
MYRSERKSLNNNKLTASSATVIAHAGSHPEDHYGFVNPPIYRGSTVVFPNVDCMQNGDQRYQYGRWNNPSTEALCEAISALEGATGTVLCPSGLSACVTAILSVVGSGEHILVPDSVYAPTRHFLDTAGKRLGIQTTYYDPQIGAGISELFQFNTEAVFTESPGSHTFEIQDIPAIAKAAHAHGALVLLDNTWATPLYFKAIDHGVDLSIMAATKYIVGHSDALIGTIAASSRAWPQLKAYHFQSGTYVSPDDANLALRGLRTLDVRLERHQRSALCVAKWLEEQDQVSRVIYPGLPSHKNHSLWRRDFTGATGLLSFVTKSAPIEAVKALLDDLNLFGLGYSWGGFESLAMTVDPRKLRTTTLWEEEGHLIRLHVGLENPEDLIADLKLGFDRFDLIRHQS